MELKQFEDKHIDEIAMIDVAKAILEQKGEVMTFTDILEEVSKMAYQTEQIAALDNESNIGIEQYLLDKHYQRKHGKNAYYGQNK